MTATRKRTRHRTPPPTPAKPRHGAHETTIAWICCDTVFSDTRAMIEHLARQHGIISFAGETTLNGGVTVGGKSIAVYECRLAAGLTVTKTVSTTSIPAELVATTDGVP
jgi:hypothetical protein